VALLLGTVIPATPARATESIRAQQWYLDVWKMQDVWKITRGAGVTVAVVDSGVDSTHPDLGGSILPVPRGSAIGDKEGHGTGMASLIVGQGTAAGGLGVYGVAPAAKVLPFRAEEGLTTGGFNPVSLAEGVRLAADSPAKIINLSVGSSFRSSHLSDAIAEAQKKGKLVVAAAGNTPGDHHDEPVYPAAFPGVLAVGAVNAAGKPASNSVRGNWLSLVAPGEEIPKACTSETRYCKGTGSSDAAALVSGIAALVWSEHPDWTANQVMRRLIDTANPPNEAVPSNTLGWGAVSPRKALAPVSAPGPDTNPLIGVRGEKPTSSPVPGSTPRTQAPAATPVPAVAAPVAPASTPVTAAESAGSDDSGVPLPVLAASIAAAVLVGGAAYLTVRRRARARAVAAPPPWPPPPPPHYQGGPYYGPR